MSLSTGNQLRAARAMAGVDQFFVAQAANLSVNTIRNMEGCGYGPITSGAPTVRSVQAVFELLGIEFTNSGEPGVNLRFVDAWAEQRDGEWGIATRWRAGQNVRWMPLLEANRVADSAARAGDVRVPKALRTAIEDAMRHSGASSAPGQA
jgi:hypothetical protein